MTDKTIDLDRRRGMEAQKATDLRRLLAEVEANERALRLRQDELEAHLADAPAASWEEAAEKVRYVLGLYAAILTAEDTPANPCRGRAGGSGAPRQRVVIRERDDRFKYPGCHRGRGLAHPRADLAAVFPRRGRYFNRCRPSSVRVTECRPPEMMSQCLSTAQAMPAASAVTSPRLPRDSYRCGWPPVAS
jgi:hypothetical protein